LNKRIAGVAALAALAVSSLYFGAPASAIPTERLSDVKCVDGHAGFFPCKNVDLTSFVPASEYRGGRLNDIWGWYDKMTKREWALAGSTRGLLFFDVTNPSKPVYYGNLIKPENALIWQDVEVYKNHAFVVCDLSPCGLQIFDLTRLRKAQGSQTWAPNIVYPLTMTNHTIDINTKTGYAYLNGGLGSIANGSPVVFDISNPLMPVPLGVTHDDGYTHDSHCRIYKGPDKDHRGGEICFNANEDTVTIFDMTSKINPTRLARVTYENATYTHQAWLTKDHSHILVADEIDEQDHGINSTTYIFNVSDLEKPKYVGKYVADTAAIDHNNYIIGDTNYAAKYTAGLRVEDISGVAKGKIREIGYFDVVPDSDLPDYDGAWSVYPFLPSGNVLISAMGQGLFVVKPRT